MHKEGVQKDSSRHSVKRPQWIKIATLPMLDHKMASPTQCRDIIPRVNKPTSPSPISMLFPINLISPCFSDAMSMLSSVQTSLEASSTSTSTSPKVQIVQPLSSHQMVLQMRFTIIRIVTILALLKQCGIFFNSPCIVALQMSIAFNSTSKEKIRCTLMQIKDLNMLYS